MAGSLQIIPGVLGANATSGALPADTRNQGSLCNDWIHEIKYDGYRLIVQRDGQRVRLFTKNGMDWTKRYPWIVETALRMKQQQFTIDGEAVVLGVDGISDFNALHFRQNAEECNCMRSISWRRALDHRELSALPLSARKAEPEKLLTGQAEGIFVAQFETKNGPELVRIRSPRAGLNPPPTEVVWSKHQMSQARP